MEILPLTEEHVLADGRVRLLGAVRTVTGAMTRIEVQRKAVLVDCGIAQGEEAARWQFPEAARDVDAVVLTHGHNDHVGSLPALLEGGFAGPIYGTRATLDIADIVLSDGLRLQGGSDRDIQRFRLRLRELWQPTPYDQAFELPGSSITLSFREAGHILGSASVEVLTPRSRVILSGDLGRPSSPILRDYETRWNANPSSGARPVDLVVMESTYGDREHRHSHDDVERELERILHRAVADGGHILVPAFAIGRTQTLLYHLNTLVEAKRAPPIAVAVDTPMGLRITELYQKSQSLFDREALQKISQGDDPLDFDRLYAVSKGRDSVRLRDVAEPLLIIAGSGMCTGGRIIGHLKELLPRPETCVLFVGYQARGTPGRAIQAARGGGRVRLDGEDIPVRASIETLSGLSAHADRKELLHWATAIPNLRRLALHHGEPEAQRGFAEWAQGRIEGKGDV